MKINNVKMIAAMLACGLMLAGSVCVNAQGTTPNGSQTPQVKKPHGMPKLAKMAKALGLSEDQKEKIKVILKAEREQIKGIRTNTQLTPEDKKERLKVLRKETRAKIAAILTPAQREEWKEMHKHNAKTGGANA